MLKNSLHESLMTTMSVKEALTQALADMRKLSPERLRAELDAHKNGDFAVALREAQAALCPIAQNSGSAGESAS